MKISTQLTSLFASAFKEAGLDDTPLILQPTKNPRFGDFQINGVMPAAKKLKVNPRELAAKVIAAAPASPLIARLEIAGPGFINIFLSGDFLAEAVSQTLKAADLGVEKSAKGKKVVIDYSSPNLAKEMHVGHLRSTIIGDSLNRIYAFMGAQVIPQNHVGDWGTQFGMLVAYLMEEEQKTGKKAELLLADLEEFYRQAKKKFTDDPVFAAKARECVVKLQHKDPEVMSYWRRFVATSTAHIQALYKRLNILLTPANIVGESTYNDLLQPIVDELLAKKIAVEDGGTKLVFLPDRQDAAGNPVAFIIQKQDGAFLYSTTDLACLKENVEKLRADKLLYVVDARQSLHFHALFLIAKKAGWLPDSVEAKHIAFGTMMNPDGKPFKTRDGGTVKLNDLLDEAEKRAGKLVRQKNPDLAADELQDIAEKIAIGAVKYADLAKNRVSDYIFNWDSMLSFEGNTAPYLQYAYTRIASLLRKSDFDPMAATALAVYTEDAERHLAVALLQFADVLEQILSTNEPHLLVNYLYQVATLFSRFYESLPILKAETPVKNARGRLALLTGKTIKTGLNLLGIDVLTKM